MAGNLNLKTFVGSSVDWRKAIQSNSRKTYFVISLFFLIYLCLGLLVDTYIYSVQYPNASILQLLQALMTFTLFPVASLVMLAIAGISLMVTFSMHNKLMLLGTEYREITPSTAATPAEAQLYNTVEEMKIAAGLNYMPKVYVINAAYMNAFASGYSEKSAMIAITQGLLAKLNRSELQAVMAHELSHIRHMDIKLTLMASLLTNLMLIVLDFFFYGAFFSRDNNSNRKSLGAAIIILRYLLPIINMLLLLYLSRTREYMADSGCVQLTRDNQALVSALLKIQNDHVENQEAYTVAYQANPHENVRQASYIFDPTQAGIQPSLQSVADLFSTHPSLPKRLAALGFKINKSR